MALRGLRQGDPLSPSLFILAEKVLSHAFLSYLDRIDEFTTTIARCPSHLLFADDIILFVHAKRCSILKMLGVIMAYCSTSGQAFNHSKCKFFLPPNAPREQVYVAKTATTFERGDFLFIYLGVSIGPGRRYVHHFQYIVDRIAEWVNGWHNKLLSSAGRLVLIKHVLSSIPIHVVSATSVLMECLRKIEAILATFF